MSPAENNPIERFPQAPPRGGNSLTPLTAREEAIPANRDRLIIRFFRLVEGEAEGRFAISALVTLVLAAFVVCIALRGIR